MKIDLFSPPKPLEFGSGEGAFKLVLKSFSDADRMAIVDAYVSAKFEDVNNASTRIVGDWINVCGPDGVPIPFAQEDEKGRRSNLPAFLAALPAAMHLRVLAAIAAFVGIPKAGVEPLMQLAGLSDEEIRPTAGPGATTSGPASKN